jgi:ABC-type Fe3+ transport system permease subunit
MVRKEMTKMTIMTRRLLWILWPAFLSACVLELLVFGFVDPETQWATNTLEWSRQAVYTSAFFAFWAVSIGTCLLTLLLMPKFSDGETETEGRPA